MKSNTKNITIQLYVDNLEMMCELYDHKLIIRNMQRHIDNLKNKLKELDPKIELEPIPLSLDEIFTETESYA